MAGAAPDRIRWAVEQLDARPGHHVLEVGCGPGVALALLADAVTTGGVEGTVLGVDRSATAVERSRTRNADAIAGGTVVVERSTLAGLEVRSRRGDGGDRSSELAERFDRVLAVNVNVFWTTDADVECAVLARVLRPGGLVVLAFGGPDPESSRDVGPGIAAKLAAAGLDAEVRRHPGGLVAVVARRPA